MTNFAALLIIVACRGDACLSEPVSVVSYHSSADCRAALASEVARARRLTPFVYGDCVPIDPALLAGRKEIRRQMNARNLSAALSALRNQSDGAFIASSGDTSGGVVSLAQ